MELMKKVQQIILGLVILLSFGCGKDDVGGTPEPEEPTYTNCRLLKITNGNDVREFLYDSQGRINRINMSQGGYGIYEYNSIGMKSKEYTIIGNDTVNKIIFEYDIDSLLVKQTLYNRNNPSNDLLPETYSTLFYDAQKRRSKVHQYNVSSPGIVIAKTNYFYPGNNTFRFENYTLNTSSNQLELATVNNITYDNFKTPGHESGTVNHNWLTQNISHYVNGVVSQTSHYSTTYTYNSVGYPLTSTHTNSLSSATTSISYQYTCQ